MRSQTPRHEGSPSASAGHGPDRKPRLGRAARTVTPRGRFAAVRHEEAPCAAPGIHRADGRRADAVTGARGEGEAHGSLANQERRFAVKELFRAAASLAFSARTKPNRASSFLLENPTSPFDSRDTLLRRTWHDIEPMERLSAFGEPLSERGAPPGDRGERHSELAEPLSSCLEPPSVFALRLSAVLERPSSRPARVPYRRARLSKPPAPRSF
jgi:hypothetical protein